MKAMLLTELCHLEEANKAPEELKERRIRGARVLVMGGD